MSDPALKQEVYVEMDAVQRRADEETWHLYRVVNLMLIIFLCQVAIFYWIFRTLYEIFQVWMYILG